MATFSGGLDEATITRIMEGPKPTQTLISVLRGSIFEGDEAAQAAAQPNAFDDAHQLFIQERCPVCMDPYTDPHCFQCGHIACKECLQQWVESSDTPNCVTCRRVFPSGVLVARARANNDEYMTHFAQVMIIARDLSDIRAGRNRRMELTDMVSMLVIGELTSSIRYLLMDRIPLLPELYVQWNPVAAHVDLSTFAAFLYLLRAPQESLLRTRAVRQQWMHLGQAWCDVLSDGFDNTEGLLPLLYGIIDAKLTTAVLEYDGRHGTNIYGNNPEELVFLQLDHRLHGMWQLLCHFLLFTHYERVMDDALTLFTDAHVLDPHRLVRDGPDQIYDSGDDSDPFANNGEDD